VAVSWPRRRWTSFFESTVGRRCGLFALLKSAKPPGGFLEHVPVQEDERTKGLVPGTRGDATDVGKVVEIRLIT
jgi:hypothetical protein